MRVIEQLMSIPPAEHAEVLAGFGSRCVADTLRFAELTNAARAVCFSTCGQWS